MKTLTHPAIRLALAACLLEPLLSRERARPGANYFALLADNSQGMKIKDRGATRSRGENLQALLTGDHTAWQPVLDELQSLATTYETCRSLGQQTTERPAAPLRPHAVTPQMAFEAAWHGVPVLGTSSDGPRVTITPANTEVDPGEVREREGAAPPATMRERLVRGVRKLDTSTRPLVQRVGEGVDEGLVEQIRKNAAKQAG